MKLKTGIAAMLLLLLCSGICAQNILLKGKITNTAAVTVEGATVTLMHSKHKTVTDNDGNFTVTLSTTADTLIISHISYQTKYIAVTTATGSLVITLSEAYNQTGNVTVSTGYQNIPKERVTGSFDVVDNKLYNRGVNTNVLNHIENLTPGVLFDRNTNAPDKLLIRGRSTIYANAAPLIVVDNFPYDGDINNINPNDVESVTILKDAAAASIWGARAGNGVIVITTKKGKTATPQVELNTNITFVQKPNLFNINSISAADYTELEKYLFNHNYYNYQITAPYHYPLTPVVELMVQQRDGLITEAEANSQIKAFKQYDVRNDETDYLYRTAVYLQHALNVSGNTTNVNYFLSAGWDNNMLNLVSKNTSRITLRTQNSFKVTSNLQIDAGISYVNAANKSGNNPGYFLSAGGGKTIYPYARLKDEDGNAIAIVRDHNINFAQAAQQAGLLNWQYNPLRDIDEENNSIKNNDFLINAAVRYYITPHLNAEIKYQFENSVAIQNYLYKDSSYYARNLVNQFTQIDAQTGALSYAVPPGAILDINNTTITSHQGRAQLNYTQAFNKKHLLAAIAGWEVKSLVTAANNFRYYGYKEEGSAVSQTVDYNTQYPLYYYPALRSNIPNPSFISKATDRFISYYTNAAYTYNNLYTVSASARRDEANLFGVKTNQKGTPLWSAGVAWQLSNERFYNVQWLPVLKFRATYGYNGNISRLASAYTTVDFYGAVTIPAIKATILNPPNASLRWEQVRIFNAAIDFATAGKRISGTVEFYLKHSKYLLGQAPVDPTLGLDNGTGNSFFYGNVAAMKGKGVDVQFNTENVQGLFSWSTSFIFSYASSKVSEYLLPINGAGSAYLDSRLITPVIGKTLYSVYSYQWAGLNRQNGKPLGYLDGKKSDDYATITGQTPLDSMEYNGPVQPPFFGAVLNTFSYKNFTLSCNISYKLGYYFRKASIDYEELYSSWNGSGDYANRWQKPGDEKITYVPARVYPADAASDFFYTNSSVLVEKGDNIRLEDITLSYDVDKGKGSKFPFAHARFYIYASNFGLLWTANKDNIDPYYNNTPANRKSFSVGLNIHF